MQKKDVTLAGVLSFLFPGLGQVYCGCWYKGIICFVLTIVGYFCFVVPGIAIWLIQIYDAVWTGRKVNEGKSCWG